MSEAFRESVDVGPTPAISIVIPLCGNEEGIGRALASIREKLLAVTWVFFFLLVVMAGGRMVRTKGGKAAIACSVGLVVLSGVRTLVLPHQFSRRMDLSSWSHAVATRAQPGDVLLSYAYPWAATSFAPDPSRRVGMLPHVLAAHATASNTVADKAARVADATGGTVFLVVNETQRNLMDPGDVVERELARNRRSTTLRFGRNLTLKLFAPGPQRERSTAASASTRSDG